MGMSGECDPERTEAGRGKTYQCLPLHARNFVYMTDKESKLDAVVAAVEECKSGIQATEHSIALLERVDIEEVRSKLTDVEYAKLNVGLAYCLASLMYVSLKTKGVETSSHPVRDEISRIKEYVAKLNNIGSGGKETQQRTIAVDAVAAKRVVAGQLSSNKRQRKK